MDTGAGRLPPDVEDLLRREKGYLTTAVAAAAGVDRDRMRRLTKAGLLVRAAQGCYVDGASFAKMDDWTRHRTKARAFATACGDGAFLTGWSAAVNWWLPTIGAPPRLPTVVRARSSGWGATVTKHGRTLVADLPAEHCVQLGTYGLMSPAWAVVDLARTAPVAHALVVADAAVRLGADLDTALPHMRRWAGASRSRWVADHAEPNIESPLETLGRFTCIEFDLPMPVCNAWVGRDGPEKRLDGLWPYHRAGYEADGALKYNNREDAAEIVRDQHEREFYIRRLGLDLARYVWEDAFPERDGVAAKFQALLRDNPPGAEPIRWWKDVPGSTPVEPTPADWPSPYPMGLILPAAWNLDLGDSTG